MLVRSPYSTAVDFAEPPDERSVSVDIGPFADQADLLRFAMLLETVPGIGHIDLIDAEPETALFIVRARSAAEVAELLDRLPDYTIRSTIFGNMVSAQIQDSAARAAVLLSPAVARAAPLSTFTEPLYVETGHPHWWRRAVLAATLGASAAGILFVALNGLPWQASPPPAPRPTVAAAIPTAFVPPRATSSPAVVPTIAAPAATASASATPAPSQTPAIPSATPTTSPTATPTASPTAVPALTSSYLGSFSASLGTIRALNGCVWDTPLDGTIALGLTRASDGSVSGEATMNAVMTYVVTETPAGATCNSSQVMLDARGAASGGSSVQASLSGARDLVVTFNGTVQGDEVVGDLSIQRAMSTVSSFGNTSETRSASVAGLTLSN